MRISAFLQALVACVFLAACGGNPNDVIVNEDVHVVDASAREKLQQFELDSTGSGTLRFSTGAPGIDALEPGRILVSEPVGEKAPHGFLQRIRSKRVEGGAVVFETEQATLEDVFERADIVHEVELKPEQLVSAEFHHPGIRIEPASVSAQDISQGRSYDFNVSFDKVLLDLDEDEDTVDDQLRIDGSFKFSAGVEMKIKIGTEYLVVPTVEHIRFLASLEEAAELNLQGTLQQSFEKEVEVASYSFGAITVPVGPVPVVFTISMKLTVGADGEISATLSASAKQTLSVQVGAEYKRSSGWENLSGFESEFDVPPPELSLSGRARAYARPELQIAVYGIGGPTAAATGFAELDVELFRDPFWTLTGGVDLAVGLQAEIPVIGKEFDWSRNFELFRRTISSAPNEAPTLEVLSPQTGTRLSEGSPLSFTVRAGDREQESVMVQVKSGGTVVTAGISERGEDLVLNADKPCRGTHVYEISVTDAKGATVSENITVVVDNTSPTVELETGTLADWPALPGGYLIAYASASDRSCQVPGNSAAQQLIQWRINGEPAGNSQELIFHIPASAQPGETLELQAFYDDGEEVAASQTFGVQVVASSPGANHPPRVVIMQPVDGSEQSILVAYPLIGRAIDPEDGVLDASSAGWTLRSYYSGQVAPIPFGTSTLRLMDHLDGQGPIGWLDLTLSATDSNGQESSHQISIYGTVPG